ncbi:MAG: TIGR03016 family PEP-CTERM system-associated outer membrane protein, partial [Betaproteobacteria bacterium]
MPEIRCAALALFAAAVLPCGAQTWRISPGVSITETYSDNLGLEAQPLASRGWLTDLSPTLHVENPLNARVHVMADYRLHALYYSDDSRRNETQNFLDALARIEAVEKSLFLDARAAINLQSRTPFGTTLAPDFPGATQNRVETRVLGLQPRWLGNLGDFAVFRAQYAIYGMRVDDPLVPDLTSQHFAAQVRSPSGGSRLGWALDTDYMEIRPDQAQPRDLSLARLSLRATVWSTVQVALSEGYDNTNISTEGRRRGTVPGLGLTWMPSPRTQFATLNERRFFGSSYATSLTHRTASTAWRLNATREVTSLAEIISAGSGMSLSSLLDSLLATAVPDPQQRSNVVAERFRRQGLSDSSPLTANFVTTRPVLRRRIEGSVAYVAPRNVL